MISEIERQRRSKLPSLPVTHGKSRTPEYWAWLAMKQRCSNPKHPAYRHYGGRGIQVCERWARFENFINDMGKRPKGCELERVNNNKGYEPGNCTWAKRPQQMRNTRRTILLTLQGKTMCLKDWCKELGKCYPLVRRRFVDALWPLEKALQTPVMQKYNKHKNGNTIINAN